VEELLVEELEELEELLVVVEELVVPLLEELPSSLME
jgi:hypothetical protein